jgi:hypothetical protein
LSRLMALRMNGSSSSAVAGEIVPIQAAGCALLAQQRKRNRTSGAYRVI